MKNQIDVNAVLAGDRRALARFLTAIENETASGRQTLDAVFKRTGQAHIIGVTGSPGAGKSSLVNQLVKYFRQADPSKKIAIIAVDPSSPFTGGALLGDRVRMRDLSGDEGIFIRSMATRGALGGLARTTSAMAEALDAAGFEMIFIETVGAGQSEVDIVRLAHTTIVVEAPGMGDDIQASKAGILEIADILVVNKADQPMAENAVRTLKAMLELGHPIVQSAAERLHHRALAFEAVEVTSDIHQNSEAESWQVPVLTTISTEGVGIQETAEKILEHGVALKQRGEWKKREAARLQEALHDLLIQTFLEKWQRESSSDFVQAVIRDMLNRVHSPHQALQILIKGQNK